VMPSVSSLDQRSIARESARNARHTAWQANSQAHQRSDIHHRLCLNPPPFSEYFRDRALPADW
jgi:hypothetical protein